MTMKARSDQLNSATNRARELSVSLYDYLGPRLLAELENVAPRRADAALKDATKYLDEIAQARQGRTYLVVSYDDKDEAKRRGAQWDATARRWYITKENRPQAFLQWLPDHLRAPTKQAASAPANHNTPPWGDT